MADVSKIRVDGVDYDVKDATARSEIVPITRGGTGSNTAEQSRRSLGVPGLFNYILPSNSSANIKFTSMVNTLIFCRGNTGTAFATLTYAAYPPGGTLRVKVGEINKGDSISYSIMNETTGFNGITFSNSSNVDVTISILVLLGTSPIFELA